MVLASGATVVAVEPLCRKARVCIYDGNDYVGLLGARRSGLGVMNVSRRYDNKMDSWQNKTRKDAAWYYKRNGKGKCTDMDARESDPNINFLASDELSSWKTNGDC